MLLVSMCISRAYDDLNILIHYVWDSPFCVRDQRSKFLNYDIVMSFIFGNSADPDEMPPNVGFHLGQHCLQKCLLTGI